MGYSTQNRYPLRAVWVTRSFLDYRVPVYRALSELLDGQLTLIYSRDVVPERVWRKVETALGGRAVGLQGEWRIGRKVVVDRTANSAIRIPFQPGLNREIRRWRPDVMIADGFFQWTYAVLLERARRGVPLVVCYERWSHTERRAQWYRRLYRRVALRFVDAICCSGQLSGEYVRSLGWPEARITFGHMAADTDGLARASSTVPREARQLLRDKFRCEGVVFLYVGRLVPRKGMRQLLDGWAEFEQRKACSATLLIAGDGPERPHLEQFASARGLGRVRFLGNVDYDQLAVFYAAADAFVMPTLEDNWSLVVPEAMACGLPVLCSKYNGCWPELVQEGRNGWVFDPLDPQDIVRCLDACVRASGTAEAFTDAQAHRRTDAPSPDTQFQLSAFNFQHLPPSALRAMGRESREIVKDHSPCRAAEGILSACRTVVRESGRPGGSELE